MSEIKIISIRKNPEFKNVAIQYFQKCWDSVLPEIYDDCISHSITAKGCLPQWYLLLKKDLIIGCAGLITNDFISRGDLYPWLCALYIDERERGNNYASLIINKAKKDAKKYNFKNLYLSTSLENYYEKLDFTYIGKGYHPWGEQSKIYKINL